MYKRQEKGLRFDRGRIIVRLFCNFGRAEFLRHLFQRRNMRRSRIVVSAYDAGAGLHQQAHFLGKGRGGEERTIGVSGIWLCDDGNRCVEANFLDQRKHRVEQAVQADGIHSHGL